MSQNTPAISASGQAIPAGSGVIKKIIVNTHSSGVIKLVDTPNNGAGRVILSDYTLPTGAQILDVNLNYNEGVALVIVSGSATIQLSNEPTIV